MSIDLSSGRLLHVFPPLARLRFSFLQSSVGFVAIVVIDWIGNDLQLSQNRSSFEFNVILLPVCSDQMGSSLSSWVLLFARRKSLKAQSLQLHSLHCIPSYLVYRIERECLYRWVFHIRKSACICIYCFLKLTHVPLIRIAFVLFFAISRIMNSRGNEPLVGQFSTPTIFRARSFREGRCYR